MMPKKICGCKDDNIETKKILLRKLNAEKIHDNDEIIYIGIVFHICFKKYIIADVEADVDYTIDMLNKDYNKQCDNFNLGENIYTDIIFKQTYESYVSLADSCNIHFYKVDIKYNPIDSQSSKKIPVLDTNIKQASPPIKPNRYLNLWIVDLNNGILGYSQFPWEKSSTTDGVVISTNTFGLRPLYNKYNLNKTMTHEIGHWFGLYHTFQETFAHKHDNRYLVDCTPNEKIQEIKGDCISDIPPQAVPTYGNPFKNPNIWPSSKLVDGTIEYKHMFMNFMDYCDDIVLFMFTHDQKIKMRQMIYIYRPDILTNDPKNIITENYMNDIYYFDALNSSTWIGSIKLMNNYLLQVNAKITFDNSHSGNKCLRTKKTGRAELQINLTGITNAILSVYIQTENPHTFIWARPPGIKFWYSTQIAPNNCYKYYTLTLPGPFNSINKNHYTIRFGTNGSSNKFSYFDDVAITNEPTNQKIFFE